MYRDSTACVRVYEWQRVLAAVAMAIGLDLALELELALVTAVQVLEHLLAGWVQNAVQRRKTDVCQQADELVVGERACRSDGARPQQRTRACRTGP